MSKITKSQYKELVKLLLKLSRYDIHRLDNITREQFGKKTKTINSIFKQGKCKYSQIKQDAMNQLIRLGVSNPKNYLLSDGIYLIVSDSHGKHTTRGMFRLLSILNQYFNFDNIIHIGNALDDDNDISYLWKNFNNLIIVSKDEQLKQLQSRRQQYKYKLINGSVYINGLRICNQQVVKQYSKTSINLIDSFLYQTDCVFNGHKQQLVNKGTYNRSLSYYCPGCVCQPHITTTVKQIDFKDGGKVKQSYPSTYLSYRNRKHLLNYWQNGIVIVQAYNGKYTVHNLRIKKINNEYVTSYFDKVFTQSDIISPQKKIFFNSDLHTSNIDFDFIKLQNQFINKYIPDVYVNLGDMLDNRALNHHDIEKGNYITRSFFQQMKIYYKTMKYMSKWCQDKHIIFGNHQRFMNDFSLKYPQFTQLFNFFYQSPIKQYNYQKHGLHQVYQIGKLKFLHGDLKLYGQTGGYLQKISKTFGSDTIIGHLHVNQIRRGCYIVGLSGNYNQGYNQITGSRWQKGFGFTNQYKGENFTQLININDFGFCIDRNIFDFCNNQIIDDDQKLYLMLR